MLRALSLIPMLFAALILRTDRRLVRQLREAKAISINSAIPLDAPNFLGSWRLSRLRSAGAVCQVQPERYYLEEAGFDAFRKQRRLRVLMVACIILPLLVIMWLWLNLK